MPILTCWDDPQQTIYHYLLRDNWNTEELYSAVERSYRMIQRLRHPVYVV